MHTLYFATGNKEKFAIAQAACRSYGVELIQQPLNIPEIQGEDPKTIVADKAARAFDVLGKPVIVSDDSWSVPALHGFPGAYMKSIDHWFSPQDFINLMQPYTDRRIILIGMLAYQDSQTHQTFRRDYTGQVLREPRGTYGRPIQKVIAMPGDNGLSVAEAYDHGANPSDREVADTWVLFMDWYNQHKPSAASV